MSPTKYSSPDDVHVDPEVTGAIAGAGVSAALSYLLGSRQGRVAEKKRRDEDLERRLRKVEISTAVNAHRLNKRRHQHEDKA